MTKAAPKRRKRRWPWLVPLGVPLLCTLGFGLWLPTEPGNAWLKRLLEAEVDRRLVGGGDFEIQDLKTNLIGDWELRGLRLTDAGGNEILAIDRAHTSFTLGKLISTDPRLYAEHLHLEGGRLALARDAEGVTNLERAFGKTAPSPPSTTPWAGLPIDIEVPEVRWNGGFFRWSTPTAAWEAQGVALSGGFLGLGTELDLQHVQLGTHLHRPAVVPLLAKADIHIGVSGIDLTGFEATTLGTVLRGDGRIGTGTNPWALNAEVVPLDLSLIQKFAPKAAVLETISGKITAQGPSEALEIHADLVPESKGTLLLDLAVNLRDPKFPWSATVQADDITLDRLYNTRGTPIWLNGTLTAQGNGNRWPKDIAATGRYEGKKHQIREITLDSLSGDLQLKDGILTFPALQAAGPLAVLKGSGNLDLVGGDLDVQATGSLDLDGLGAFDVQTLTGEGPINVHFSGNVLDPVRQFQATGTIVVAPFLYEQDVVFERLELQYRWRMTGVDQSVDFGLDAKNGVAYGVGIPHLTATNLDLRIPENRIMELNGPWQAEGVDLPGAFVAETLQGTFQLHNPPDARERTVQVDAIIGNTFYPLDFIGTEGSAHVRLEEEQVAFDVAILDGRREFLNTRGTFGQRDRKLDLQSFDFKPTFRQHWRIPSPASLTLLHGGVHNADLNLESELGRLVIKGDLGRTGPLNGTMELENFQLDALAELDPARFSDYSGQLDLSLTAEGDGANPELSATVLGQNLWIPGVSRWLDLRGDLSADRFHALADLRLGAAGSELALLNGSVPLQLDLAHPSLDLQGGLDLKVVLVPGTLQRLEDLTESELGVPKGRISAVLHAGGTLGDPDFRLTGVTEMDVPGWSHDGRVEFAVHREGRDLALWADLRQGFASRGHIQGTAATRMGDAISWALTGGEKPNFDDWSMYADNLHVKVAALGTPIQSLLAVTGTPFDARGDLLGGVVITGSPKKPRLSGAFNWTNAQLGLVPLTGAYVSLVPSTAGYTLESNFSFLEGTVGVSGQVPIAIDLDKPYPEWGTGNLDLAINGDGFPIGILQAFDEGIRDTRGLAKLEGRIGGTLLEPEPDVALSLHDGALGYQPLGIRLEGIELDLSIDPKRLQLRKFEAQTLPIQRTTVAMENLEGRGRITAKGTSRLKEWRPQGMNFQAELDRALLSQTWQRIIRLSGPLSAQGDWPELSIEGDLKVDQGKIAYSSVDGTNTPLVVDPSLTIHRGESRGTATVTIEDPPLYERFNVDVQLDLNRSVDIDARVPFLDSYGELSAQLSTASATARLDGADLRLSMNKGELQLTHTIKIVEGSVNLLNSQFEIRDGEIHFNGDPTNPLLDLQATRSLAGGTVTVAVSGSAQAPDFNLISDEFDQTAIFTILVTGQAPEQLSAGGNASTSAVVSALLNGTGISSSLRTQMFSIEPDGKLVAKVPIPRYRNIEGKIVFNPFRTNDENLYTVGAEAALFGRLRLDLAWGDKLRWADLFVEFRF